MGNDEEDVVESAIEANEPEQAAGDTSAAKPPARGNRKWVFIGLVVGIACIIALSLGLRFGLDNNDDDVDNSSSEEQKNVPTNTTTNTTNTNDGTTAGGNNEAPTNTTTSPGAGNRVPLITERSLQESYDSCDSLAEDLKAAIRMQANYTINQNINDPYLFNEDGYFIGYWGNPQPYPMPDDGSGAENGAPTADSPAMSDSTAQKGVGESSYGTNNQVEGVDEPDIVKSDGTKVWVAYGGDVVVLDTNNTVLNRITVPAAENTQCEQVQVNVQGLLLIDDRLIAITVDWCNMYMYPGTPEADASTGAGAGDSTGNGDTSSKVAAPADAMPMYQGTNQIRMLMYDKNSMTLVDTLPLKGDNYITARAIENIVHLVNTMSLNIYPMMSYVDVWNTGLFGTNFTKDEYRTKALALLEENLDEFVNTLVNQLDCTNVQQIVRFQNQEGDVPSIVDTMSVIYSIDVSSSDLESSASSVSMLLPAGWPIVYSSQEKLVLAVQGYWFGGQPMPLRLRRKLQVDTYVPETYLITYSLGNAATYQAYGKVGGYADNSYFLHHLVQNDNNYLYIATNTQAQWGPRGNEYVMLVNATSQLYVLDMSDMSVVGQVNNLGKPGETIFAIRYIGEKAFIVTYFQTDPFITMDLSDPSNPAVVGELEIPGFSNYLHQVGENLILGVGQATDPNTGWSSDLKISLFDVSNFAAPREVQNFVESGDYSSSDAQYDFHAFRYLPDSKLLILPLSVSPTYNSDGTMSTSNAFDGFRVYGIDEVNGITVFHSIAHASGNFYDTTMYCWSSSYLSSRSLVFSGDLMTFKGHSILHTDLNTKSEDAPAVNLDEAVDPSKCSPYGGIYY